MKSLSMRSVCLLLLIALVMGAFSLTACQKSDPLAENGISSVTVNGYSFVCKSLSYHCRNELFAVLVGTVVVA